MGEAKRRAAGGVSPRRAAGGDLGAAIEHHRAGRLESAETIYRAILERDPADPEALHFYGLLKHMTGRSADGAELVRRATVLRPAEAGWHSNLGNIHLESNRRSEARDCYQAAIRLDPRNPSAQNNLGVVLRQLGDLAGAEAAYRAALGVAPRFADAWNNLGHLMLQQGRKDEALEAHLQAVAAAPKDPATRRYLVRCYVALDRIADARATLEDWLAESPNDASARYLHASVTGENVPDRADDAVVVSLFDGFAATFDSKLDDLGYRAPQLVADALATASGVPDRDLDVLDAGCGTGLCGPLLRGRSRRLEGVDLSPGMLVQARARGAYDALHEDELTRFLERSEVGWDAIVSADTLCYFGGLDAVLSAARRALRPGGILVFTVEEDADADGFRLHGFGRYSHGRGYVVSALERTGFGDVRIERERLRFERGEPVAGLLVSALRVADAP